ncbi:arfaptin-1-like [Synchiropus picturatus]
MMEETTEVTYDPDENPPHKEVNSDNNHTMSDVAPSPSYTSETAQQTTDAEETPQKQDSGLVVVHGKNNNIASETLQRVRKWSIHTYKRSRQALSEKLGRGSRTVDLELEPRVDLLKDSRLRYNQVTKLAQTLATQLAQFSVTQKTLGEAFADLSLKSPALHVEFGMNAEAQMFLSKSGETLTAAINAFTSDTDTLVNKTIEDTLINVKQYEEIRVAYDAYRVDMEELNLGPRDAVTLPKLERAQKEFQCQKERYKSVRDDLSVKLKLLEENKVKVLHNHLWLLHSAVATHCISCHEFLVENIQKSSQQLIHSSVNAPSWLEDS